jgi:hypothetical protein
MFINFTISKLPLASLQNRSQEIRVEMQAESKNVTLALGTAQESCTLHPFIGQGVISDSERNVFKIQFETNMAIEFYN